jgi:hypothetical protein
MVIETRIRTTTDVTDYVNVTYTNEDDGIYIVCRLCGGGEPLGQEPTVGEVFQAAQEHVRFTHG